MQKLTQRTTGYVTRWDERGYGFIHRDDIGGELFVHGSELTAGPHSSLVKMWNSIWHMKKK